MVVEMPKYGLIMTEGTIAKWYKNEGDHVHEGEVIASIETQKLSNDLESPVCGTLTKILVHEEETAPCQSPIAEIEPD